MLQLQLYRLTGDTCQLRAARRALRREIGFCVRMRDGACYVRDGRRHLSYLDGGSSGIALAAQEYLAHGDAELGVRRRRPARVRARVRA